MGLRGRGLCGYVRRVPIEMDLRSLPLVIHRVTGDVTREDVAAYIRHHDHVLGQEERVGVMLIVPKGSQIDRSMVDMHAVWMRERRGMLGERWVGLALVLEAAAARFMLTSFLLMSHMPIPYRVCDSYGEGARFLAERFLAEGIPLPDSLRPYCLE
jgi:hypothetical protein